jgi:hypothetical protein
MELNGSVPRHLFVRAHRAEDQRTVESGVRFDANLDTSLVGAAEPSGDGDVSICGGAGVIR